MSAAGGMRNKDYLFSSISVNAVLISGFAKIKRCLVPYPGMTLERDGTKLLYSMSAAEGEDHFFLLELGKESISMSIYSRLTPMRFIQEAMLRLLGVMQTLSDCYKIEIGSVYPYLIMTIAEQQLDMLQRESKHTGMELPDIILSKRLIAVMNENLTLVEARDRIEKNFKRVVLKAVLLSGLTDYSIESIAGRLGIEKKEVTEALDGAESMGYRVVNAGRGTFNLVRI